jgi:hypothetical protein
MTVHKFAFDVSDTVHVLMPKGAQVLHVDQAVEGKLILLWALVEADAEKEERVFYVRGTGHPVEDYLTHIGTTAGPVFVWHIFERVR